MDVRFNYVKVAPGAYEAMLGLERYLKSCAIEEANPPFDQAASLADQWMRLLPRHALERPAGNRRNEQRMYSLDAWRECPVPLGPRAGGAGVDRSRHQHHERPRAGCGL